MQVEGVSANTETSRERSATGRSSYALNGRRGESEVAPLATTHHTVPALPGAGIKHMKGVPNVGRQALVSTPLVEHLERLQDRFRVIVSDGRVDADEQAEITRELAIVQPEAQRVHRCFRFVGLAIQGDGVDGDWFGRRAREDRQDRLRVVVRNDDPDPPAGPAQRKRAA